MIRHLRTCLARCVKLCGGAFWVQHRYRHADIGSARAQFRPHRFGAPIRLVFARLASAAVLIVPLGIQVKAQEEPAKRPKISVQMDKAETKARESFIADLCQRIEAAAHERKLPPAFFARLIWTESRFDPNAVSPKGAAGVAQFMPETARERGLDDPFDPRSAIPASAHLLADLHAEFGNLGLAAAAYNAGPNRVRNWREGRSGLPIETQNFVLSITGVSAHLWKGAEAPEADFTLDKTVSFLEGCRQMPTRRFKPRPSFTYASAKWQPWNVALTAGWSPTRAMARYATMKSQFSNVLADSTPMVLRVAKHRFGTAPRFEVGIGKPTRAEASVLCRKLRKAGGVCVVQKTRSR